MNDSESSNNTKSGSPPLPAPVMASYADPSFNKVRPFISALGIIPNNLIACIRQSISLRTQYRGQNAIKFKQALREIICPLVSHSPSTAAAFYYAAQNLHSHKLKDNGSSMEQVVDSFEALETLGVLALPFLTIRLRKACDPELWPPFFKNLQTHIQLGHMLGRSLRGSSAGEGMTLAGLRYIAIGCLMVKDSAGYRELQAAIAGRKIISDPLAEEQNWGCSHLQAAALLSINLGFGHSLAEGYMAVRNADAKVPDETERQKVLLNLVESFHCRGTPYERFPIDSWFHDRKLWLEMRESAQKVHENGADHSWLVRRKSDLTPDIIRQLGIKVSSD